MKTVFNKSMVLFLIFGAFSLKTYGYEISITDEDNLLNKKTITFNDREELKQEINKLLESVINKGYVTSLVKTEGSKLKIVAGKVNKVILEDKSTFFPKIKKSLFGLNLEDRVLNIADINNVVERYNRNSTNKLNVSIENSDKENYADLIVTNDYHFKASPSLIVKYGYPFKKGNQEKEWGNLNVNVGLDLEQILGLNDKLSTGLSLGFETISTDLNYSLLLRDLNLQLGYKFFRYKESFKNGKAGLLKNHLHSANLNVSGSVINKPDLMMSVYGNFVQENSRDIVKNTTISNKNHTKFGTGLQLSKYLLYKNNIFSIDFNPNVDFLLSYGKSNDKNMSVCLITNNKLSFNSTYYSLDSFFYNGLLLNKGIVTDKCRDSNKIVDFDAIPLEYNSYSVLHFNNSVRYPINIKETMLEPFAELAFGRDFENKKTLFGVSAGISFSSKYVGLGIKYGYTKNEQDIHSITMRLNTQF